MHYIDKNTIVETSWTKEKTPQLRYVILIVTRKNKIVIEINPDSLEKLIAEFSSILVDRNTQRRVKERSK